MRLSRAFQIASWRRLSHGTIRLTRLNIYSGLYLEYRRARVLIDPSKILSSVATALAPDLILVSHESMDHFDAELCLKLLEKEKTYLIGSWGVIIALTSQLPADDPKWSRIYPGIPGTSFKFGDLVINIEESLHCEYAVPILFEIQDRSTGFRILDAVDSEITSRMTNGEISPRPDIFVVPLGIALAANAAEAWKMVELLRPQLIFANHYTDQQDEFIALAGKQYREDKLVILKWYEGVTLAGPDPKFEATPEVSLRDSSIYPDLAGLPVEWINEPPSEKAILAKLGEAIEPESTSTILYFLAWNSLLGEGTTESLNALEKVRDRCLTASDERLTAAFLLAFGATASAVDPTVSPALAPLRRSLTPENAYIGYWVLESWGRASKNQQIKSQAIGLFEETIADEQLFAVVGIRRKLMWEAHRMVEFGYTWPGLSTILLNSHTDQNPDVRLLAYKIFPLCHQVLKDKGAFLADGLGDNHEDVLEWAVIAHIELFDLLGPKEREYVRSKLPEILMHCNYHVRDKANILAELLWGDKG